MMLSFITVHEGISPASSEATVSPAAEAIMLLVSTIQAQEAHGQVDRMHHEIGLQDPRIDQPTQGDTHERVEQRLDQYDPSTAF